MIEAVGTALLVVALVVAWQMAEDRGVRIPILGLLSAVAEWVGTALFGLILPLCVFGLAFLILEPAGVSIVVPAGSAAVAFVGAWVFGRWRNRDGAAEPVRAARWPRRSVSSARIDALHEEGWRLLKERRFRAAAAVYRQAAEIGDVDAMVNLATILVDELDAPEEAERWYRRAIEAGNTTAAENLGLQRLDEGRVEEARELFELARRSGDSAGYLGLAEIAIEEGELERARGLLEIALMEGDLEAYAPLGFVLASLGRDAEAEQRLRDGLALGATGVVPILAHLLRETGREAEADELCAVHGSKDADRWPPQ